MICDFKAIPLTVISEQACCAPEVENVWDNGGRRCFNINPSHDLEQSSIPEAGRIILQKLNAHHMSISTVTLSF